MRLKQRNRVDFPHPDGSDEGGDAARRDLHRDPLQDLGGLEACHQVSRDQGCAGLAHTADPRSLRRSRLRSVIAARFSTTTRTSSTRTAAYTIGLPASTLGDWNPTS